MTGILEEIREGMSVLDSSGSRIGTVDFVHLTDDDPSKPGPEVVTVSPALQEQRHSLMNDIAEVFRADDVPETLRERLLLHGFIRVDAKGLFAADRFVMPDQIQSVSGDEVVLAVSKDQLIRR